MKTILLILLALTSSITLTFANEKGNGGTFYVCPSETNPAKRYVLYDIFEWQSILYGVEDRTVDPIFISLTKDQIIKLALNKVEKNYGFLAAKNIELALDLYLKKVSPIPPTDVELELTLDMSKIVKKKNCAPTPVVNWMDNQQNYHLIKRNDEIYHAATTLTQAQLDFHEAVYYVARTFFNHPNSDIVRNFVSQVFSVQSTLSVFPELKTGEYGASAYAAKGKDIYITRPNGCNEDVKILSISASSTEKGGNGPDDIEMRLSTTSWSVSLFTNKKILPIEQLLQLGSNQLLNEIVNNTHYTYVYLDERLSFSFSACGVALHATNTLWLTSNDKISGMNPDIVDRISNINVR